MAAEPHHRARLFAESVAEAGVLQAEAETDGLASDERGFPTNMTLRSLGILRPKDVPPIEVELVEVPQPKAAYGIKGVGEIGLVPTAGAVAAMLHMVDGQWRTTLPMRRAGADAQE